MNCIQRVLVISAIVVTFTPSSGSHAGVSTYCETRLAKASRLERAIESSGTERLQRFFSSALLRYSNDPRALAISASIAEKNEIEIGSILKGVEGSISIERHGSTLEIELPVVQLDDDSGAPLVLGEVSKRIDTRFVALMAGVEGGIGRRLAADPSIDRIAIESNVVNERLANLLRDLGFGNPIFGRSLTREEIHFVLTQKKFPPSLYDIVEQLRAKNPQWATSPATRELVARSSAEKDIFSIPYRLELALPPADAL